MRFPAAWLAAAVGTAAVLPCPPSIRAAEPKSTGPVSYYRNVRPILQENCQGCHQPAKREGGLVITTLQGMKKGGDSRDPGVVPRDPDKSTLISEITADAGHKPSMPKGRDPLTATQVALIRRWIVEGAIDDTPAARAGWPNARLVGGFIHGLIVIRNPLPPRIVPVGHLVHGRVPVGPHLDR